VSALGRVFVFFVFFFVILLFVGVLLWFFLLVSAFVQVLGLALVLILVAGLFYLYVKLAFAVQALAFEQGSVKQALQQSWELALGRFWQVLVFLFLVGLASQVFSFVGSYFADMVLDDVLASAVLVVFWGAGMAFAGVAMALYYAEKKLGKSI
jgi:membrane-anchored glycerophosphoryl diester phosphodiesterase (GDPDase)